MSDDVVLIQEVIAQARRLGLLWTLRYATVIDGDDPSSIRVTFDGDVSASSEFGRASGADGVVSLVGVIAPGTRVATIFVPPAGQYIIGFVGVQPVNRTLIATVSSDTTSAAIGAAFTATDTITDILLRDNCAYYCEVGGGVLGTTAGTTFSDQRLYVDGVSVAEAYRFPVISNSLPMNGDWFRYIKNVSGADKISTVDVRISTSSGTTARYANAGTQRWFSIYYAGPASVYPYASSV